MGGLDAVVGNTHTGLPVGFDSFSTTVALNLDMEIYLSFGERQSLLLQADQLECRLLMA